MASAGNEEPGLQVIVTAAAGDVLLDTPLSRDETIGGVKRRLESRLVGRSVRLVSAGRELYDRESIRACAGSDDAERLELTGIIENTFADELRGLASDAERRATLQAQTLAPIDVYAMTEEQCTSDCAAYEEALSSFLLQYEQRIMMECRRSAEQGKYSYEFDVVINLQGYEFGRKVYFAIPQDYDRDPVLRGLYLSNFSRVPGDMQPRMQLSAQERARFVQTVLTPRLAQLLTARGLVQLECSNRVGLIGLSWARSTAA
eukprot:TRINITY_DN97872_c0_g1_i1.p1 TRINITY_DN97872_c0_g1~~TRINITY_DN97872_c0_g1_i1.p1  ORF type:complete len:260 (-),score=32.08 TRINITY_DN97872_c0_g1_i1:194-973(-)